MEAFSLLKFWRTSGSDACTDTIISCSAGDVNKVDVRNRAPEASEDTTDDDDDSFFDLVFTAPNGNGGNKEGRKVECNLVHGTSNRILSEETTPCKTKVFPVDSNSKPQSPVSLLKSAPKFRVFLLGFRKSKSEKMQANEGLNATPRYQFQKSSENVQSKRFTVKCKVEEVPVASLFSRDNSLRSKLQRERSFVDFSVDDSSSKALQKDIPKYLKLIKPLYARASKRYTEQSRLSSDRISSETPLSSPATAPPSSPRKLSEEKRVNRAAGFRVVSKHLGKSRSASSTVGAIPSPANRRDDTLLLQHDGIQSAILYCKKSYNLSNGINSHSVPINFSNYFNIHCH